MKAMCLPDSVKKRRPIQSSQDVTLNSSPSGKKKLLGIVYFYFVNYKNSNILQKIVYKNGKRVCQGDDVKNDLSKLL